MVHNNINIFFLILFSRLSLVSRERKSFFLKKKSSNLGFNPFVQGGGLPPPLQLFPL
ncbi:hypothetical protein Peur_018530 [Populus x canadensis]